MITFSRKCSFIVAIVLFHAIATHGEPRNLHGRCSIRINEIHLGQNLDGYLELAKVCPSKKFHDTTKLTGFAIIILKSSSDGLICGYSQKLNNVNLQQNINAGVMGAPPTLNVTTPQPAADRSLNAAKVFGMNRNVQHTQSQSQPVPSSSDAGTLPPVLENHDQTEYDIQENAKLFHVIDVKELSVFSKGFQIITLLHLDSGRMKQRLPCHKNKTVDVDEFEEIKENLYDFIILYANDEDGSTLVAEPLFQPGIAINEVTLFVSTLEHTKSFSKCDSVISNDQPSQFKRSPLTKFQPNKCPKETTPINQKIFVFPFSFQGTPFDASGKKLILNLVQSLRHYKENQDFFKKNPKKLAADLLNIAETTITRFEKQFADKSLLTPKPKRKGVSKVMAAMDDQKRALLYKSITSYYAQNEVATISEIQNEFIRLVKYQQLTELETAGPQNVTGGNDQLFSCSLSTFRKLLKIEGYKFGKIALRDSVIFEPRKILWRRKYLNRMKKNRETKQFNVLYIDETWIDPHSRLTKGVVKKCYQNFEERRAFSFGKHKVSRGGRILIMAAGGREGFIKQSNLVWKVSVKQTTEDYHSNMNRQKFEEWFVKLMDNVDKEEKKYIFVFDNAPYHTSLSAPLSNANKAELIAFLKKENVENGLQLPDNFEKMLYIELKQLVKKLKEDTPRYKIDDLARARGHEVVRIPPYNCDLNPIEEVWKDIKYAVRKANIKQEINAQVIQAKSEMNTYSVDLWNKHVNHIEKLEEEYFIGDMAFDSLLDQNNAMRNEANAFHDIELDAECEETEENDNDDADNDDAE